MNTLSKDKLEHILCYAKQQHAINLPCKVPPEDMVAIVEMALRKEREAAVPVGEVVLGSPDDEGNYPHAHVICLAGDGCADWDNFPDGFQLYTAPPAQPVAVPDEITADGIIDMHECGYVEGWNACRAAMLNQPASNLSDGVAAIRNAGIAVDADKIQAELDALNSPVWVGVDWAEGCKPSNSPVIPDGYALVPIEPTEAMMLHKSGCQHHAWDDADCAMRQTRRLVWAHMIAAAPGKEG